MTSDYLAYTLIDAIVDHYFVVLEGVAAKIESLEDMLIDNPKPNDLENIHDLKRQLILMRKATWPLREVVGGLERAETNRYLEMFYALQFRPLARGLSVSAQL